MTDTATVRANGVELCLESFGDLADPAVLLIGGAASSMDWWEKEFCWRLAAGGRRVLRYDNRDTGQSTSFPAGAPGYTGRDLVGDAAGLLDAVGVSAAHVVGLSMGGGIAQVLGVEHPARVASLTLVDTTPAGPGADRPGLPPMAERLRKALAEPAPQPDFRDRDAVIEAFLAGERRFAGTIAVEESRIRNLAGRVFDRTRDMAASMTNHWILEPGGEEIRVDAITAPTMVLHGTDDPLFPLGHGEALAREIPGARLVPLPGGGHQYPPPPLWDLVIAEILAHTR